MKRKWIDKKVLILGLSKSGISAAKYLNSKGADCYITEKKQDVDEDVVSELKDLGIKVEHGAHSDEFMDNVYLAVTSPGIPPKSEVMQKLKERDIEIISEVELAYLETLTPFVGITGTNGKTTTTTLISEILSTELKAPVCGNIGVPPTSLIDEKNDYLVCELSSYQIEFSNTLTPQIALFLNFTPDHVDWHEGLENYWKAKIKLFAPHKMPAFAVFNGKDEKLIEYAKTYMGEKFFFALETDKNCCYIKDDAIYFKKEEEEKIIDLKDVPIVGEHNYQNVMASIIPAKIIGISNENIYNAIKNFKAVEHRCEFVKTYNNIDFYNDSKATNPEAAIVAIRSFPNKTVTLIAGGRDKNTDLGEFCQSIKDCIKDVILLGEAKDRFKENLTNSGFNSIVEVNSLEEAIDKSIELGNEISLLSPACASFDMFKSYEDRGCVFKNYVLSK